MFHPALGGAALCSSPLSSPGRGAPASSQRQKPASAPPRAWKPALCFSPRPGRKSVETGVITHASMSSHMPRLSDRMPQNLPPLAAVSGKAAHRTGGQEAVSPVSLPAVRPGHPAASVAAGPASRVVTAARDAVSSQSPLSARSGCSCLRKTVRNTFRTRGPQKKICQHRAMGKFRTSV